jgi:predicted ATPase/class 3 adenylate cyclase
LKNFAQPQQNQPSFEKQCSRNYSIEKLHHITDLLTMASSLTFLFTDVQGSTVLWERYPGEMRISHERQREIIIAAVANHDGEFIRTRGEGDSTFSIFTSARAAVLATAEAQRQLQCEPWPPNSPVHVRMALHSGEGILYDGDYNSTDVNRCARLRAIAHGDQALVSQRCRELCLQEQNFEPSPEFHFIDLGSHRLKDLQEPEHVFQLGGPGLRREFPAVLSLDSLPNILPRLITSFVGRCEEIGRTQQSLETNCLVTLSGSGGAGKTRLALQVGAEVLSHYPDGVWFVELAPLADPAQVARTVATALGLREDPGRSIEDALIDHLRSRTLLIILDNCEHLLGACARLAADVLRACPHAKVLATSREPLGIRGEAVYCVPSLTVPAIAATPPVLEPTTVAGTCDLRIADAGPRGMMDYDSIRLFVERARLHLPNFNLTQVNAAAVVELCRRLDGIPLAIELAAARARALTVEQIVARLDHRFQLLTSRDKVVLPRHQTLRALVDWSYELLSKEEQAVLTRISVFAGLFSLEAAEIVASAPDDPITPVEQWQILDLLTGLVDK